jgi:protein associated with RNAse G/E
MKKLCIGDRLQIQCYKHNGKIHRSWNEAVLLDFKKDYFVFANSKTKVTESEGNIWRTKEPAIMYFFKDKWFNIIAQMKSDGIYYYCNIASPFIIEEGTIKYIDYDLDLRIFNGGEYKVLDKSEYKYHKKLMNYSDDLDLIINSALDELINLYLNNAIMFNKNMNYKYLDEYNKIKSEQI